VDTDFYLAVIIVLLISGDCCYDIVNCVGQYECDSGDR